MNNQCLQQDFNLLPADQQIQKGLQITKDLIAGIQGESAQIILPDDLQSFTVLNLEVSPFPTQSRKVMKYIETESLQKFADKQYFVNVDNFSVAFVNVEDLSYHNFENILNLDHLFNQVQFEIITKQLVESKNIQIFNLEGSTETLLSLDKLNYYTVPLNSEQRGGKRLIFHSNQLSIALTRMIALSDFVDKKNFSHVNCVFRLNNFAPGDKKFKTHYDTPYADKQKNQFSKYTMLIYLTGNNDSKIMSNPPLKIEDFEIKQIEQNDCIIFDQKCEHEGNAYEDNNKIFIRTELIYELEDYEYDEKIARMFNMACYMTKEIGQQQYSTDLFNNCVKMRHRIALDKSPEVYLEKMSVGTVYVTNGNDYWFSNIIDLKSIAVLIILDYFNGKMKNLSKVKIQSKVFPRENKQEIDDDQFICNYLQQFSFCGDESLINKTIKEYQNLSGFIPKELCQNFDIFRCDCELSGSENSEDDDDDDDDDEEDDDENAVTSLSVFKEEKEIALKILKSKLDQNSVMIFDKEIVISYDKIKIQIDDGDDESKKNNNNNNNKLQSGKIRLSDFYINPGKQIHFAGQGRVCRCKYQYRRKEVAFSRTKRVYTFCLPDISFQYLPNGIKLSIDIFNNGVVYSSATTFKQPYTDEKQSEALEKRRLDKLKQEHGNQYSYYYNGGLDEDEFENSSGDESNEDSCYHNHQDYQSESSFKEEKEEEEESSDSEDKEEEEVYNEEEDQSEDEYLQEKDDEEDEDDKMEDDDDDNDEEEKLQNMLEKKQKTTTIKQSSVNKNEKRKIESQNLQTYTKLKKTKE